MDKKKEQIKGHGHFIDIFVYLADCIIINLFFILIYKYSLGKWLPSIETIPYAKTIQAIALVNLSYLAALLFVRIRLSANIIHVDHIAQRTTYFTVFYMTILVASLSIFKTVSISFFQITVITTLLIVILSISHLLFRSLVKFYRKEGYNYKNIIIVGGSPVAEETYQELSNIYSGYKIVGFFSDKYKQSKIIPNYLGSTSQIIGYLQNNKIDEVYFAIADGSLSITLSELISYCEKNMIRFHLIPDLYQQVRRKLSLQFLETIPILSLRHEPLQHPLNRFAKRCVDIVFSLLVIVFILPIVYIILIPFIKLNSPGPIHFIQKRTGFKGMKFSCFKFRSMQVNRLANEKGATKDDPRVTKIGSFMRKTSIDELPQFINVLRGEMSVVGPRPHMLQHTEEYSTLIEKFMVRHLIKPGITGWAQVTGSRGETKTINDMEDRVRKDVWYIENWSLFLDLKIILRTLTNAFKGEEKAY